MLAPLLRPCLTQCARSAKLHRQIATRMYVTAPERHPSAFGRPSPASAEPKDGTHGKGMGDSSSMIVILAGLALGGGFFYLMTSPKSAQKTVNALPDQAVSHSRIEAGDNHQVLRNEREHK